MNESAENTTTEHAKNADVAKFMGTFGNLNYNGVAENGDTALTMTMT